MFEQTPIAIVVDDVTRTLHAQFENGIIEEYQLGPEFQSDEMWNMVKNDLAPLIVSKMELN
jgi:hypothetical protein